MIKDYSLTEGFWKHMGSANFSRRILAVGVAEGAAGQAKLCIPRFPGDPNRPT